jgi:hypothetical protein
LSSTPRTAVSLGAVTIRPPSTNEARCSLFEDLAGIMGVETNEEAVERLETGWLRRGHQPLDIDGGDTALILAGQDVIVEVALLIDELAAPSHRGNVTPEEVARVRGTVSAWTQPERVPWAVGDVFAIPLADGTFAFGQVLWEYDFGRNSTMRAPTCLLLGHRASTSAAETATLLASPAIAILHVSSENLDLGRWVVVGRAKPARRPFSGPCGRPDAVGSTSWDGLEILANAWHGLAAWNDYGRDDYLDRFLLRGISRPPGALIIDKPRAANPRARKPWWRFW